MTYQPDIDLVAALAKSPYEGDNAPCSWDAVHTMTQNMLYLQAIEALKAVAPVLIAHGWTPPQGANEMTTTQQAQDKAVEALMDCYHAYGEHPDYKQSHALNKVIEDIIGDILTPAQITEAMAVCHDIDVRRTQKPDLFYKGHDIEPADGLYMDALADYEHDNEQTLYRIIQQAITTNNKE